MLPFDRIPSVTRNLLILNVLVFIFTSLPIGEGLKTLLVMFNYPSPYFKPFQLVTHIFVHADIQHLLMNMIGLYVFGPILEQTLGDKRFFILYMSCGIGAGILVQIFDAIMIQNVVAQLSAQNLESLKEGLTYYGAQTPEISEYGYYLSIRMLGASGAIVGLFAGVFVISPNMPLQLLFIPIQFTVKKLFLFTIALELVLLISGMDTGIGHDAHLAGALIGFIIVTIWNKNQFRVY